MKSYSLTTYEDFAKTYLELRQISGGDCETHDIHDYARSDVLEADTSKKNRARTMLPAGNSMLVDLGSRINLIGRETSEEFVAAAHQNGLKNNLTDRPKPLLVNGVGQGSAPCHQVLETHVSVKYGNTSKSQIVSYHANVADGCGSRLPAILGLDSMTEKDAVLILRDGKRCMAFPGKNGYKIEWSPGTKLLPLETSPSGHLVIPCDSFQGACTDTSHVFITDNTIPDASGNGSSGTLDQQ